MTASSVDTIVSLAKRAGFVFPSGEIYGGTRSAWDYGPLGVELKENIKRQWWKAMVQGRDDIVGLDSSVILPRAVWEASGHVAEFVDPLVECQSCHRRFRADHLQEAYAGKKGIADPDTVDLGVVACSNCGAKGSWTEPKMFNGLLKTFLGPVESEEGLAYLRPETAQGIFVNFKHVMTSARRKPPFGIGQIGKSFRNEITPGNFIFRTREFEQMEMEFFVEPGTDEQWHETWLQDPLGLVHRPGHRPREPALLRAPGREAQPLLQAHRRHRVPLQLRRQRVRRARGHRQPHRLRPHHPLQALRGGPELLRPGEERALDPVRDRAGGRRQPVDDGVPDGCLHRGRGAQRQGRC
jgi:glycyl-tRNA synthetase